MLRRFSIVQFHDLPSCSRFIFYCSRFANPGNLSCRAVNDPSPPSSLYDRRNVMADKNSTVPKLQVQMSTPLRNTSPASNNTTPSSQSTLPQIMENKHRGLPQIVPVSEAPPDLTTLPVLSSAAKSPQKSPSGRLITSQTSPHRLVGASDIPRRGHIAPAMTQFVDNIKEGEYLSLLGNALSPEVCRREHDLLLGVNKFKDKPKLDSTLI